MGMKWIEGNSFLEKYGLLIIIFNTLAVSVYWLFHAIHPSIMLFGVRIHAIASFYAFIALFVNLSMNGIIISDNKKSWLTLYNVLFLISCIIILAIPLYATMIRCQNSLTISQKIDVIKFYTFSFFGIMIGYGWIYYINCFRDKIKFYNIYSIFLSLLSMFMFLIIEINYKENVVYMIENLHIGRLNVSYVFIYLLINIIIIYTNFLLYRDMNQINMRAQAQPVFDLS